MRVYENFPLKEILYYKIGGKAKFLLKIENKEDLLEALEFIQKEKPQRVLPVGLGSNLLVSDDFFDGVVLLFSNSSKKGIIQNGDGLIEAFASVVLDDLIQFSFSKNLIGLEWAGGLPSTIGGAVRGNIGAFGGEIRDIVNIVEIVRLLDKGYIIEKLTKDQLEFGYRDSIIKCNKNLLVVSAEFRLQKASKEEVEKAKAVYKGHIEYRNKNHPMEHPSCGSVFKNITKKEEVAKIISIWGDIKDLVSKKWYHKVSTGYVINRLGFSGFSMGGAKVSEKHGNYIVNFKKASFDDLYSITEKIKDKFSQTFGFYPELEVEVVE